MRLRRIACARTISVLFILAACPGPPVFARDKTDVVVMTNGDRLTCEVKRLESGLLQVDLDYVDGTVSIDWFKVARLESSALFLVQLQDGSIYSAKVVSREALAGTPLKIEIQPKGQEPLVVGRSSVARMSQTSESRWQRFSGNIGLGAQYSKGNNTTQYNLSSELDYQKIRWGGRLNYSSNLSSNTGAPTATRNQLDLTLYHLLPWKNYFYGGDAGYMQSSVQGIQAQTTLGFGLGRYLKNTPTVRFSVLGGLAAQRTDYVASAQSQRLQNIGAALISSNLEVFSFKKTRLQFNASLAPALSEPGRLFARINASYYLKLFGKIDWNVSFYGNWDTRPPVQLPSSDYGSSTGLSWTFGNK